MIQLHSIEKSFDGKPAFSCTSFAFEARKVHGVVGLNGAGKTTFFNLIAGFSRPDRGTITLNKVSVGRETSAYLESLNYFYPDITGMEYLRLFPQTNEHFELEELNRFLGLPLQQLIEGYSAGMQKKLALLAILKQDKPIYIFDEPLNGLDLESVRFFDFVISRLREKGKTVFISSHILAPLKEVCDTITLMVNGHLTQTFMPDGFDQIADELYRTVDRDAGAAISKIL